MSLREPEAGGVDQDTDHSGDSVRTEPCLHCDTPVPLRKLGCKAGHCPNCRHPYPHGDCSD